MRYNDRKLSRIISESVKKVLNERILGPGERFTPYTEKDRRENFAPYDPNVRIDRSMEERNPSYAKELKAAQERAAAKKMSISDIKPELTQVIGLVDRILQIPSVQNNEKISGYIKQALDLLNKAKTDIDPT